MQSSPWAGRLACGQHELLMIAVSSWPSVGGSPCRRQLLKRQPPRAVPPAYRWQLTAGHEVIDFGHRAAEPLGYLLLHEQTRVRAEKAFELFRMRCVRCL
jgi:hypothetical protein